MKLKIKDITKLLLLCFITPLFSSCIMENFDNEEDLEKGPKRYMSIRIKSPEDLRGTRTRANDFQIGDTAEYNLGGGNYAIFFNAAGVYIDMASLSPSAKFGQNHIEPDAEGNVEATYTAILNAKKENLPRYVYVVLNGSSITASLRSALEKGATIQNIANFTWNDNVRENIDVIGRDDDENFTLTNSSYVKNGQLIDVVDILADGQVNDSIFFEKREDAEKSRGVIVHVERMVAKIGVSFNGYTDDRLTYRPYDGSQLAIATIDKNGDATYVSQNWHVRITGWGVNGVETSSYLFKRLKTSGNYYSIWRPTDWNDEANFRSYWAEDPHYTPNQATYPYQYRRSIDKGWNYYEGDKENGYKNFSLKFYSYNELNNFKREYEYVPENTYNEATADDDYLDYRSNKLAGTHVLICGKLQITRDGINDYQDVDHLYRNRIGICYLSEKDCFSDFVRLMNRKLESQFEMDYYSYDWSKTDGRQEHKTFVCPGQCKLYLGNQELTQDMINNFSGDLTVDAIIMNGDGKRLPWIDGLRIVKEEPVAGGGVKVTTLMDDSDDLRSLLYEWYGPVEHYNQGLMYYAAPITQRNYLELGALDEKANVYGVVRNHWYNLNIKAILNLGVPIDEIDDPIVPNRIITYDNIKLDVQLIPWHVRDSFIDM